MSHKRPKLSQPPSCVVRGDYLRSVVAGLNANRVDGQITISFTPHTPLYLGDRALLDATLGQESLAHLLSQPRAWLLVTYIDDLFGRVFVAIPAEVAVSGAEPSALVHLDVKRQQLQPWLQHANVKVTFEPDDIVLQCNENPLATFKLRRIDVGEPDDWRGYWFQTLFPNEDCAGVLLRLPVHDFAAALRSVTTMGTYVKARLVKAPDGPSVVLQLIFSGDGLEVQAALKGVQVGSIYDLCAGIVPVSTAPARTPAGSPLEIAMQQAEQVEAATSAAEAAVQAAAAGDPVVEFAIDSKLHSIVFGDKGKVAEMEDALLLHYDTEMCSIRVITATKDRLISAYGLGQNIAFK